MEGVSDLFNWSTIHSSDCEESSFYAKMDLWNHLHEVPPHCPLSSGKTRGRRTSMHSWITCERQMEAITKV